jgi:predicted CxxxxCH...CXXCH cytochrome family protein
MRPFQSGKILASSIKNLLFDNQLLSGIYMSDYNLLPERKNEMILRKPVLAAAVCASLLAGCGGGDSDGVSGIVPGASSNYILVAWNDLGMHCLNPTYDTAVILPPYNTVWAQVLKRGNPPQVVTSGVTVSYRILNNETSQKTQTGKFDFTQFWANAVKLFKTTLALDKGLNLDDPGVSNGLSGTMLAKGDHFQVSGIPVVPYNDGSTVRNPYQVAEITVRDSSGTVVAQTRATVPTSEEINCGKCHAVGGTVTDVFNDILARHDAGGHGTTLLTQKPVLCASCHGSPALGTTGPGSSGKYLSQAIHGFHDGKTTSAGVAIGCYDCHPGESTKCNRSIKHTDAVGNCTNISCHGSMATIASSISAGRIPWVSEPKCVTCHSGVPQVDTGSILYRNAKGHGGVYCAGCHGSPHAMYPVDTTQDITGNYQPLQYQVKAMVLGDCRNCHSSSRGEGNASEFASEHGSKTSACNVCHTGFQNAGSTANWPHQFQWKDRR